MFNITAEVQPREAPQLPWYAPLPQAKKKILAIGSRATFIEFFCFYVLHLAHGEHLDCVYLDEFDEEDGLPEALKCGGYERIYALNATPGNIYSAFRQALTYVTVSTQHTPGITPEGWSTHVAQRHDDCLMLIDSHMVRLVTVVNIGIGKPYPLSSALMEALFFLVTQQWFRGEGVASMGMKLHPSISASAQIRLLAVFAVLEHLPAYANRDAFKLHEELEALERTFEVFDAHFKIDLSKSSDEPKSA